MNLVDSSGWLEYFSDAPNAHCYTACIEATSSLIVPSIILYEVFKKLLLETNEGTALEAVTQMQQGRVIPLDEPLALDAARLGFDLKLSLADSIILATARAHQATLFTQDDHFKGLPDIRYFPKKK